MTIEKIINHISDIKPHAFSDSTITNWINECEGHIQTEIIGIACADLIVYDGENDRCVELIVKPPHDKIYSLYCLAMIDFANGEYSKYENTMQLYNAARDEFAKWFIRTHQKEPKNAVGYYISAYGLAVSRGFEGTVDEWLESLRGARGEDYVLTEEDKKEISELIPGPDGEAIKNDILYTIEKNIFKTVDYADIDDLDVGVYKLINVHESGANFTGILICSRNLEGTYIQIMINGLGSSERNKQNGVWSEWDWHATRKWVNDKNFITQSQVSTMISDAITNTLNKEV